MLKKILIVSAPVAVFLLFLLVFMLSSGPKSPEDPFGAGNTTVFNGLEKEFFADFTEDETEEKETGDVAESTPKNTEAGGIAYDAPYTLEEIKGIFEVDRALLEQIKNTKMPQGYTYFQAVNAAPYKIDFYGFDGGGVKSVSRELTENGEYGAIYEFFKKYGQVGFIHAIDPESGEYAEENLIAQFGLKIAAPSSLDYIPWAEIRYNRIAGEIEEKTTSEYITIPLDEHWYYIYSNIY